MIEYQNVYIILCCIIIYSCIKISFSGFLILNLMTLLYVLHEDQSIILKIGSEIASAKASQEFVDDKEIKVTVNPRKNKELNFSVKNDKETIVGDAKSANVDNKNINLKPSPYQHSYEQRKRLLESVYMDLETNNKWKSQDPTCKPIRSQSNYKL